MLNRNFLHILLGMLILLFSACHEDNIDEINQEDENPTVVVNCSDFDADIYTTGFVVGVNINGGMAPYTVLWSTGEDGTFIEVNEEIGNYIQVNEAGIYSATVTDVNGCELTVETVVDFIENCGSFGISTWQSGLTELYVNIVGGTPPISILWSTMDTTLTISPSQSGVYGVSVVDALGCIEVDEIDFTLDTGCANSDLFSHISFDGNNTLTGTVLGGSPPYTYQWIGDIDNLVIGTNSTLTISEDGIYHLIVIDADGCQVLRERNIVIGSGLTCNDQLSMYADNAQTPFSISNDGEAWVFKGGASDNCSEFELTTPEYEYNYIVVDADWDVFGTGDDISYYLPTDGIAGFTFGKDGIPEVGDQLDPIYSSSQIYDEVNDEYYGVIELVVVITLAGNEVGEQIGGFIHGQIRNQDDDSDISMIHGEFCVPIVNVCE